MIGDRLIFFAQPLQRSNLCASHRQRRWLTCLSHGLPKGGGHQGGLVPFVVKTLFCAAIGDCQPNQGQQQHRAQCADDDDEREQEVVRLHRNQYKPPYHTTSGWPTVLVATAATARNEPSGRA